MTHFDDVNAIPEGRLRDAVNKALGIEDARRVKGKRSKASKPQVQMMTAERATEIAAEVAAERDVDPQEFLAVAPIGGRPVIARFRIDGQPVSKSRARFTKRGSKAQAYTPEKTKEAEDAVGWAFRRSAPSHRPRSDREYAVVTLFVCTTRQRRDVDNMTKLILDGLNGVAWEDDDQVTMIMSQKWYDADGEPYTEVIVADTGPVRRQMATCEYCENQYATYDSWMNRRFCTAECHYAWRRDRRRRACAHCGEEFVPDHAVNNGQERKFCGVECFSASKRATVICDHCGVEFTKQRCHVRKVNYCSDECRADEQRQKRRSAAAGVCEVCGGPTTKKSYKRCAGCLRGAGGKPKLP